VSELKDEPNPWPQVGSQLVLVSEVISSRPGHIHAQLPSGAIVTPNTDDITGAKDRLRLVREADFAAGFHLGRGEAYLPAEDDVPESVRQDLHRGQFFWLTVSTLSDRESDRVMAIVAPVMMASGRLSVDRHNGRYAIIADGEWILTDPDGVDYGTAFKFANNPRWLHDELAELDRCLPRYGVLAPTGDEEGVA
jgi:hypothetical protein